MLIVKQDELMTIHKICFWMTQIRLARLEITLAFPSLAMEYMLKICKQSRQMCIYHEKRYASHKKNNSVKSSFN